MSQVTHVTKNESMVLRDGGCGKKSDCLYFYFYSATRQSLYVQHLNHLYSQSGKIVIGKAVTK